MQPKPEGKAIQSADSVPPDHPGVLERPLQVDPEVFYDFVRLYRPASQPASDGNIPGHGGVAAIVVVSAS